MAIRDKQARFSNDENHNPAHQRSSGGSKASHRTQQRSGRRSLQDANTGASNDRDSRIRELEAALAASQSEVADLRARPLADQDSQSASGPRIRRPTNVSKVTMGQLRTSLGMGKAVMDI
ncbi:hypothetical protein B0H14DRAFT_2624319 [Mycena olivaceomarginata]|nr:hypothetical protein B0H14DRAFT_2624319 [Mycena olivaceomarginata]